MNISLFISSIKDQNSIDLYNAYNSLYNEGGFKYPIIYCDDYNIIINKNIIVLKSKYIKNSYIKQNILCTQKDFNLIKHINYYHNIFIVDKDSIKNIINKINKGETNEI